MGTLKDPLNIMVLFTGCKFGRPFLWLAGGWNVPLAFSNDGMCGFFYFYLNFISLSGPPGTLAHAMFVLLCPGWERKKSSLYKVLLPLLTFSNKEINSVFAYLT